MANSQTGKRSSIDHSRHHAINRIAESWLRSHPYATLTFLTLACLLPFVGKAFHADDTLFVWAAQQITKHPLNPYGFNVVWYNNSMPMAEVTKNPPLASYYMALVGLIAGWSEVAMHLAFLLPALGVILGTYYLATRLSPSPLLAAAAALLTPGFLVSSSNVMCDTMMLAFWLLAVICWIEGLERNAPWLLLLSALVIAFCALTKYFGAALIPLLLVYSLYRHRKLHWPLLYLLIPIAILAEYQHWTHTLYGRGLLSDAAEYASTLKVKQLFSPAAELLVGLGFTGGCVFTGVACVFSLWSKRWIAVGLLLAVLSGLLCFTGWVTIPALDHSPVAWKWLSVQLALFTVGGLSVLAVPIFDFVKYRDPNSALLGLWIWGTFVFATFLNWTSNARSILPMIPAAGILISRHLDDFSAFRSRLVKVVLPLLLSGTVSVMLTMADTALANTARDAAYNLRDQFANESSKVRFEGHWGFQYYMQKLGFSPLDVDSYIPQPDDILVIPANNANTFRIRPEFIAATQLLRFEPHTWLMTMFRPRGAGFYSAVWGPLPFSFGETPPEEYVVFRLGEVQFQP